MKEIKTTRTIEEVTGYEAFDGTKFTDKRECEKYEKLTAEEAIDKRFLKLIVAMFEELAFTDKVNLVGSGIGEGNGVVVVKIKDEDDLNIAKAFQKIHQPGTKRNFTEDMIGKEILVYITGDYYITEQENGDWNIDSCWIYGTVEDQIRAFAIGLKEVIKDNRWDE